MKDRRKTTRQMIEHHLRPSNFLCFLYKVIIAVHNWHYRNFSGYLDCILSFIPRIECTVKPKSARSKRSKKLSRTGMIPSFPASLSEHNNPPAFSYSLTPFFSFLFHFHSSCIKSFPPHKCNIPTCRKLKVY